MSEIKNNLQEQLALYRQSLNSTTSCNRQGERYLLENNIVTIIIYKLFHAEDHLRLKGYHMVMDVKRKLVYVNIYAYLYQYCSVVCL